MSFQISLQKNKRDEVKKYSTNNLVKISNINSSRSIGSDYEQKGSQTCRFKAFNMNDSQRRIKRQHSILYKQSSEESGLFQRGIRKINPKIEIQPCKDSTIKREYHNKQTYNILNPTPLTQTKLNHGGVRRIYLYDQRKQSTRSRNDSSKSRKYVKDTNKESDQKVGGQLFIVKKLPTHLNAATQWHNSMTPLQFNRKNNITSKQNLMREQHQSKKKNYKQCFTNIKNKSNLSMKENGITLDEDCSSKKRYKEQIDFSQNYYKKYSRINLHSDYQR